MTGDLIEPSMFCSLPAASSLNDEFLLSEIGWVDITSLTTARVVSLASCGRPTSLTRPLRPIDESGSRRGMKAGPLVWRGRDEGQIRVVAIAAMPGPAIPVFPG